MHTLKVTLKQHTPLIHFQHDQEGATLRASEVKPKLDKYVLTQLGNGNYKTGIDDARRKGWLVGKGEHPALDYKMRIEATGVEKLIINEQRKYTEQHENNHKPYIQQGNNKYLAKIRKSDGRKICDLKQYPLFFANMDADYYNPNEYRKFSFTEAPIIMVVLVKSDSLYKYIANADLLNDFFFQTNFGTRQSKGFGSFGIDENDELYREKHSNLRFMIPVPSTIKYIDGKFKYVFERIDLFCKALRGGINLKDRDGNTTFYFKSLAFMYAKDVLQAHWDKRKIKEQFYNNRRYKKDKNRNMERELDSLPKQKDDHGTEEPLSFEAEKAYDVRDCLGLSTNEQWLSFGDSIVKTAALKDENGRFRKPKDGENLPFDRMRSPILIKPIFLSSQDGNADAYVAYVINILLQDNEVGLEAFKDNRKISVISSKGRDFLLDIPSVFSTKDFFDYVFNKDRLNIDVDTYVESNYRKGKEYRVLSDVFNQIKNNYNHGNQ